VSTFLAICGASMLLATVAVVLLIQFGATDAPAK